MSQKPYTGREDLRSILYASAVVALVLLLAGAIFPRSVFAQAALPSWNDTAAKSRIMEFVKATTTEGGDGYVAPEDRIAVFDNDGTLWSEQPYYFQLGFVLDRIKALAPEHPEWKEKEPYKSVLSGNLEGVARSGEMGIVELVTSTHAGMTTDQFNKLVTDWFATARHPKTGKPFYEMTFVPMVELLQYLRSNGFKTYIVSGGGIEFMRPVTEKIYGVPSEQVIGSTITTQYALVDDVPSLKRLPKIDFIDDGPGKPVGINQFIGRRPIFVAGNSDGDYEMARWATGGQQHSFALFIHHTDSDREFAYDRKSAFGRLDKALDEAGRRNWLVVDMKADWKRVYAFDK